MRTDRPTVARLAVADRVRVVSLVLLVVGSGCATAERAVAPSPAIEAAKDQQRPQRWFGVVEDDEAAQTRWTIADGDGEPEVVGTYSREPIDPGTEGGGHVTDVAFDQDSDVAFVGLCCEPVPGWIGKVTLDAASEPESVEQGLRLDVLSGEAAFARSDGSGSTLVRAAGASPSDMLDGDAGGAAVALARDGGTIRAAVLVDTRALNETTTARGPELVVHESSGGTWTTRTFALEEQPRFCGIAFVGRDRVGLLRFEEVSLPSMRCVGSQIDVYDLEREELRAGVIRFAEGVQHVGADDSSAYLIYTSVSGKVGWRSTSDGASGSLADGGFVAADW